MIKIDFADWSKDQFPNSISPGMTENRDRDKQTIIVEPFVKLIFNGAFRDSTKDVGVGLVLCFAAGDCDAVTYRHSKALDPEQDEASCWRQFDKTNRREETPASRRRLLQCDLSC